MTHRDEGRADDRGPGGRDLGGLGRAGRHLRALRHRGALPLRPLRVRHGRRASAARSTPGARSTRSPRVRRRCGSARWSRRRASATRRCWPSSPRPPTTSPTAGSSSAWAPAGRRSSTPRYGFPFLAMKERMDVLEEQLAIVHDGHWKRRARSASTARTTRSRTCRPARCRVQRPHPPLIMGGDAGPRAARLAARFADEYNTVMPTLDEIARAAREHRRGVREGRARADPVLGHDHRRDRRRRGRVRRARCASCRPGPASATRTPRR